MTKNAPKNELNDTVYELKMPEDYMHMLNCIATFTGPGQNSCDSGSKTTISPCQKLTSNLYPGILNNHYMKPSHKKPYFYVRNQEMDLTDIHHKKVEGDTDANRLPVILEVHCGQTRHVLTGTQVTYIKAPMYYTMEPEELMSYDDTTQTLEFPDYICYEILNVYIRLLLEQSGDPRLSTHIPINQTIGVQDNN
jgi:hypothetical protein